MFYYIIVMMHVRTVVRTVVVFKLPECEVDLAALQPPVSFGRDAKVRLLPLHGVCIRMPSLDSMRENASLTALISIWRACEWSLQSWHKRRSWDYPCSGHYMCSDLARRTGPPNGGAGQFTVDIPRACARKRCRLFRPGCFRPRAKVGDEGLRPLSAIRRRVKRLVTGLDANGGHLNERHYPGMWGGTRRDSERPAAASKKTQAQ